MPDPILVARHGDTECALLPAFTNRHGLITGATGTGKTITLQALAESLSRIGVPVFMADIKGDLTGISQKGTVGSKLAGILKERGLDAPAPWQCPTTLWDVFGEQGHPVRATVSDMGPLLISRMLALNDIQQGVLSLVFKIADDRGLLLLDLKDLRAMLQHVGDNASEFQTEYGNISAASIGAIQRGLMQIDEQGGDRFFGEPMLSIADFMQTVDGQGVVNILAADKLLQSPRLYATFLLWMLSELFEFLPEVGDLEQPKLVFFFDEAHLLFKDAPAALVERIELVVRLVRSKGVGVFFVTQNPLDIPDTVLGQLGNRVQHALRAFTPRDQKAVKTAADTMRPNPKLDIAAAIGELAVGEALVSFLDAQGRPSVTERVFVLPPGTQIGPITPEQRTALRAGSLVAGVYEKAIDRVSAYETLKGRVAASPGTRGAPDAAAATAPAAPAPGGFAPNWGASAGQPAPATPAAAAPPRAPPAACSGAWAACCSARPGRAAAAMRASSNRQRARRCARSDPRSAARSSAASSARSWAARGADRGRAGTGSRRPAPAGTLVQARVGGAIPVANLTHLKDETGIRPSYTPRTTSDEPASPMPFPVSDTEGDPMFKHACAAVVGAAMLLAAGGCATESSHAVQVEKVQAAAAPYTGVRVPVSIGKFDNRSSFMRGVFSDGVDRLGGQASASLVAHLQQSQRFAVLDRANLDETARETQLQGTKQALRGASYVITGDLSEFGRKEVGDVQLFGILGHGKRQVAYAKITLNVVDSRTSEVVFSARGAGEYELSNREVLGFGGTASYDATLNGKVLDLAMREAVDNLVAGKDGGQWAVAVAK